MQKVIITAVGKNTSGIIAKVATKLAEESIDILDISQTIVHGFFNMMMIVDMEDCKKPFSEISDAMERIGEAKGIQIKCQREEIFDKMHRL